MYVPEFVCGVVATILAEIILLVAYVIYDDIKKKRK